MLQNTKPWDFRSHPMALQFFSNIHLEPHEKRNYSCSYYHRCLPRSRQVRYRLTHIEGEIIAANHTLFPFLSHKVTCTMLVIMNLAEPHWINIGCDTKLLTTILCQRNSTQIKHNRAEVLHTQQTCESKSILHSNSCYQLTWQNIDQPSIRKVFSGCDKGSKPVTSTELEKLYFLINCTSATKVSYLTTNATTKTPTLVNTIMRKYGKITRLTKHAVHSDSAEGHFVCQSNTKSYIFAPNTHLCTNGGMISISSLCDNQNDCSDGSDEFTCFCSNDQKEQHFCKHVSSPHKCGPLYYNTVDGICKMHVPKNKHQLVSKPQKQLFTCFSNKTINTNLVDDFLPDCGPHGEDEGMLKLLLKTGKETGCTRKEQTPCRPGHPRCFFIHDTCSYKLGKSGNLEPCRNGGHLVQCHTFECSAKYKCVSSYCIPWTYFCDGKWDCLNGEEEDTKSCLKHFEICKMMFRCANRAKMCIHPGNVCDGTEDCPGKDDELLCELKTISCLTGCFCLGFALHCIHIKVSLLVQQPVPFAYIAIQNSSLVPTIFNYLSPTILILTSSSIQSVCKVKFSLSLGLLDCGENALSLLSSLCFYSYPSLTVIKLDFNDITNVETHSFYNLSNLLFLNLSSNPLTHFSPDFVANSATFLLKITEVKIKYRKDKNEFQDDVFKAVVTDDYHICCLVKKATTRCTVKQPWHAACQELLPESNIRSSFFAFAGLVVIFNTINILIHLTLDRPFRAFSLIVVALSSNDILCAVYLGIIWMTDLHYQGHFSVIEEQWRSSSTCFAACLCILLFSVMSSMILILMSLSRLRVVVKPVDTKFKDFVFVKHCISFVIVASFVPVLITTFNFKFLHHRIPNVLCLPFLDVVASNVSIQIITWFLACLQVFSAVSILVMHILLIHNLTQSQRSIRKSKQLSAVLVFQLVLITSTNFLCWFPTLGIFISAMFLTQFPREIVLWTLVCSMPLNSYINPIVVIAFFTKQKAREKN